jgi:hypothetical protein
MTTNVPIEKRFWQKVDKSGDCWLWTASRSRRGYGQFWNGSSSQLAHRVAYEYVVGPIPAGASLDHKCHTLACVNPNHLRPVSQKQNCEHRLGAQANSQSGVRGVSRVGNRWKAAVKHNGQTLYIGLFADIADAEAAAIARRNELFTHNDTDRAAS